MSHGSTRNGAVQPGLTIGVVATCRHPGRATALNALAGEHPGRLQVLPLDVAVARSREELVRELPLVLDGARIDLLINNAGLLHGGERFGQVAQSDLEASLHTNAIGPFLLTQALAPWLAEAGNDARREGAVVANLSSEIGSIAQRREFRTPSYAIGKAAQNMGTVLLDKALAPAASVANKTLEVTSLRNNSCTLRRSSCLTPP